jgi:hypothetical protein
MKHVVTQSDLDENPELVTKGIQVGDEIELPEGTTNLSNEEDPPPLGDDSGGNHPEKPPGKP